LAEWREDPKTAYKALREIYRNSREVADQPPR
jgi:hypothetical protein